MEITAEDASSIFDEIAANLAKMGETALNQEVLIRMGMYDEFSDHFLITHEPAKRLALYVSALICLLKSRDQSNVQRGLAELNNEIGADLSKVSLDLGRNPVTGQRSDPINLIDSLTDYSGLIKELGTVLNDLGLQYIQPQEQDIDEHKEKD